MEKDNRPASNENLFLSNLTSGIAGDQPAGNSDLPSNPDANRNSKAALVQQILASRTFAKSVRLSQFLEFICRKTLAGQANEINEQQIGIHVFGRSQTYNAADDSIVRTQARLLRQRLEEYFDHECPGSDMIVIIPKGGYVPVFERRAERFPDRFAERISDRSAERNPESDPRLRDSSHSPYRNSGLALAVEPAPVSDSGRFESVMPIGTNEAATPHPNHPITFPNDRSLPQSTPRNAPWKNRWLLALAAITLLAAGSLLTRIPRVFRAVVSPPNLWSSIFRSGRPVVIVPSDDGLVLSEEFLKSPVSLDEYLSGSYVLRTPPEQSPYPNSPSRMLTAGWLNAHQYTSTADLGLAMRLERLPEAAATQVETRYARVLRLDDLKTQNVVLIGGIGANPWVGLFNRQLNFDVNYDWKTSQGYVVNKNPRNGELAKYLDSYGDGLTTSYGVLAYLPGINGEGAALLFEGSGMAGTEAAADFPFNQQSFSSFLKQIGYSSHQPIPFFEVLMETKSVGGNAPQSQVLAWRVISR